jgi:uncharacterized RmlC-like cupin family protein
MGEATRDWRDAVRVVRGTSLTDAMRTKGGRATALGFTAPGDRGVWIGTVTQSPASKTGKHHHGRHEAALYVVRGHAEIRWGDRLEFGANVGPGDFIYFTPFVPHQEYNKHPAEPVEYVVVRTDDERIAVALEGPVDAEPTLVS